MIIWIDAVDVGWLAARRTWRISILPGIPAKLPEGELSLSIMGRAALDSICELDPQEQLATCSLTNG